MALTVAGQLVPLMVVLHQFVGDAADENFIGDAPEADGGVVIVLDHQFLELADAVLAGAGQSDQAAIIYSHFTARRMERRTTLPLREMKNYFIVFNTLMRKAVEYGHVHPL